MFSCECICACVCVQSLSLVRFCSLDCSLPNASVHGIFPGKNTRVGCHAHVQEIFPTQELNPHLLHCRQILYCWAIPGEPLWEFVMWKSLSHVWPFVTPWTKQSMEFSRPEYWSGKPFPSPGDLPNPGIEPRSPTFQVDSLPAQPPGKSLVAAKYIQQILKTQQWPQGWKRSVFIPIPKNGMPKNAQTTTQLHSSHMLVK